jgi:hypothetical protein
VLASQSGIELLELHAADSIRRLMDRDAAAAARPSEKKTMYRRSSPGGWCSNVKPSGGWNGAG